MQDSDLDETDLLIDNIKGLYAEFNNPRSPILKRYKIEFNLFYEKDLKFRRIVNEITLLENNAHDEIDHLRTINYEKYLDESGKKIMAIRLEIEEKYNINVLIHFEERNIHIADWSVWLTLFTNERLPIRQSFAVFKTMFKHFQDLKISHSTDIQINNKKPWGQFSNFEKEASNFNTKSFHIREMNIIERALNILEPFKSEYEGITPDENLLDKLRNVDFQNLQGAITNQQKENQEEESEPKGKPSIRAIALYCVFRIEKGIELPFDKRTPNKTKAIQDVTTEWNIDNSTFRKELKIVNSPNARKNIKYKEDYKQAIQLLGEDKYINNEAIILAQNELRIFAPLG